MYITKNIEQPIVEADYGGGELYVLDPVDRESWTSAEESIYDGIAEDMDKENDPFVEYGPEPGEEPITTDEFVRDLLAGGLDKK